MTRASRYLVILSHDLHVRNFLASGCLDALARRGHELSIVMPGGLISGVQSSAASGRLEPIEPYLGGRVRRFLRRRFTVASFVSRRRFRTYRHKIRLQKGSPPFMLQVWLFSLLGRVCELERFCRWVEGKVPPRRTALALIERLRPDIVFCPTLIWDGPELEVMKAARRRGIPTAGFAAAWDTLTSKGFFLVPPDYLLVWGEENLRHAVEYHGFPRERVFVTGAPHLDVYAAERAAEPRDQFLSRRGISPEKRVILFAGTTITYWEDEPMQLRALSDAVVQGELKDCVIWYRPHPRRPLHQVGGVENLPGVYLDDQAVRQKTEGRSSYSSRPEDLWHYRSLMDAVEGVVTAFSTMIIEAALLGKPSLVVGFGLNDATPARLIQHAEYEHSLEVLATPGVTLCRSLDELKQGVQRIFSGEYAAKAAALRARAGAIARNLDGGARERIVDLLERLAADPASAAR